MGNGQQKLAGLTVGRMVAQGIKVVGHCYTGVGSRGMMGFDKTSVGMVLGVGKLVGKKVGIGFRYRLLGIVLHCCSISRTHY